MSVLLESWLALGLLTAAAWAASCIIDVCLVGTRVFQRPSEAVVVTGLFSALPLSLLLCGASADAAARNGAAASAAMLSGGFHLLHVHFYFRALFARNDASSAEIFNTLCVMLVPLLAFLVLDERLPGRQYLALALAIGGVCVLAVRPLTRSGGRATVELLCSVLCLSIGMVLQARAFQELDFATGSSLIFTTMLLGALVAALSSRRRRASICGLCRRLGPVFAVVELVDLAAVVGTQRATDVAPSVSLVALAECALPVLVICFSAMVLALAGRRLSSDVVASLALQTSDWRAKLIAVGMITSAITVAAVP